MARVKYYNPAAGQWEYADLSTGGKDGKPGKTAYEYAKDGGYTGTEAEFSAKLAQEIPAKTSELTNDSGFITQAAVTVKSVNSKTGAVVLSASDVGADASGTAGTAVSGHNVHPSAHNDIRLLITTLTTRLDALANSDDDTLDQMAELVAYIKENRELISGITTDKVNVTDIINNLTTNVFNKPLSAAQGVALKALIDALDNGKLNASELTTAINTALAQAKASGEFKGEKGDKGDPYTLTSTDKSAIVNAVIAALPVYNGEVS